MSSLEQQIKDFARGQGVKVVGVAGPERLDGPPSLDPTYILPGAKSIVSMAMPMDVPAIYEFLSKKSATPHNIDQKRMDQWMFWTGKRVENYIVSLGHRAKVVPTNSDYRRSPDIFATHPSFSFRFGAIAAGIAAQGWSGNVMTKEYGAAIYLTAVVTDAVLRSDPALPPRYFVDNYCAQCKLCEKTCPVGMFESKAEEYILLNNELHPRAKRRNIDLCNTSCFGLHGLSRDKKWTSCARYWIEDWIDREPDPANWTKMRLAMIAAGQRTGTSYQRYELIRRMAAIRWPEAYYQSLPAPEEMPPTEEERQRIQAEYSRKLGIAGLDDCNVLTCGQCALVCGPTLEETLNRYHLLAESGLVVPGPGGKMVRVDTYEEAVKIRKQYPSRPSLGQRVKDNVLATIQWPQNYLGFQPKSIYQGLVYGRRLKRAVRENQPKNRPA